MTIQVGGSGQFNEAGQTCTKCGNYQEHLGGCSRCGHRVSKSGWREKAWAIHMRVVGRKGIVPGSDEDRHFLTLALCGEVGELANLVKKTWRGDFTVEAARADIGGELADARIYLEVLARALGCDLDAECERKLPELLRRWPPDEGGGSVTPARQIAYDIAQGAENVRWQVLTDQIEAGVLAYAKDLQEENNDLRSRIVLLEEQQRVTLERAEKAEAELRREFPFGKPCPHICPYCEPAPVVERP